MGSLQSEVGRPGDWDPACAATHLTYDASDDVWQGSWTLPAGSYEYKAALNDSWDENYGLHGLADGANIPLSLGLSTSVKFYYDHKTHWITDKLSSVIAVAAGSFQSELGCPGDWQPDCLRSWLQDPDGDGIYTFVTTALPAGSYEAKAAINESWDENYGQGGVANGVQHPLHGCRRQPAGDVPLRLDDPWTDHRHGGGAATDGHQAVHAVDDSAERNDIRLDHRRQPERDNDTDRGHGDRPAAARPCCTRARIWRSCGGTFAVTANSISLTRR